LRLAIRVSAPRLAKARHAKPACLPLDLFSPQSLGGMTSTGGLLSNLLRCPTPRLPRSNALSPTSTITLAEEFFIAVVVIPQQEVTVKSNLALPRQ